MNAARYNGLDGLRAAAALAIVSCHLSIGTSAQWSRLSAFGTYAGVEIFAAMSGFLLAPMLDGSRDRPVSALIARKAVRLLPPFLGWTAFYLIALSLLDWAFGVPRGYLAGMNPRFLATAVLRGAAEVHLWFIPSLFVCSAVLIVADRLLPPTFRGVWAYMACGAAVGLAGSYARANFAFHDVRLLGWLAFGMGMARAVGGKDATEGLRRVRRIATCLVLPSLATCLFAQGSALWQVADMMLW